MALAALVLGVLAVTVWLGTAGATAYVIWRYVYSPWKVVRADIAALNQERLAHHERLLKVEQIVLPPRVLPGGDEAEAAREAAHLRKRMARA